MSKGRLLEEIMTQMHTTKQTEKQKQIVDAAIQIFAEKGYSNTSTAEIAKLAGVAEGTIFKHFGTKDKLLLSIIVPYIKEFFPVIAEEVMGQVMKNQLTTFEEFLRGLLQNRVAFITENREIFQVIIKEVIYKEEMKQELLPLLYENISSRLLRVIDAFKERGELINLPSEKILNMLLTFFGGFFVSRFVLLNKQTVSDEEIEDAIYFIVNDITKPK
ncbi:TetR/AcrR family transcriptional regulator [Ectobacillus antri]|uniref:TetR/AcrR family transcriptional regulator n=1 Tax=Ectobacillus antri TaxID=2486280 RepID=A0ABT6H6I3_9BACI|nr:TetR/AcrR family transcriptional regulator [Ectobacillus antri]MDG4656959.1 TetR/AcrR family transcriptional regulator [Ectobacillus antri]MDG5754061.1 TetR/AcrR family transcriptional regulator [Ectobacillus antri]